MSATRLPDDDPDVADMHVARILAMSDEKVEAEIRARGDDPDEIVARMQAEIAQALAAHSRP